MLNESSRGVLIGLVLCEKCKIFDTNEAIKVLLGLIDLLEVHITTEDHYSAEFD